MLDRPTTGDRTILVQVDPPGLNDPDRLTEFQLLASTAGAEVLESMVVRRLTPDARLYVGSGKAEELRELVVSHEADIVMFGCALSPSQERNLEAILQARVLDRSGLILDIFAQRARSFEGKLQVELAQLRHLSTRLIRGWTHLERQKGGIGLRGPGETQLETDRRLINGRIKQILGRLEKVRKQREQGRRARSRAELSTVSLVGYTNAGKSTLFNRLTESRVYVADQLFATLDSTLRRVDLERAGGIILADTVGFVRDLPHELVAAFRSTLEETSKANLLLHVTDAADVNKVERMQEVNKVLESIDANKIPQIQIYNKIDRLDGAAPHIDFDEDGNPWRVWISAFNGEGLELVQQAMDQFFSKHIVRRQFVIPPSEGRLRARLFDLGSVLDEQINDQGEWCIEVDIGEVDLARISNEVGSLARYS